MGLNQLMHNLSVVLGFWSTSSTQDLLCTNPIMHVSQNTQINWENSFSNTKYWRTHLLWQLQTIALLYEGSFYINQVSLRTCTIDLAFHKLITLLLYWLKTWVASPSRLREEKWMSARKCAHPNCLRLAATFSRSTCKPALKRLCFYGNNLCQCSLVPTDQV